MIEKVLEMRGMRRREIVDYFMGLNDLANKESTFSGEHFQVEISEETFFSIGSLTFHSTVVKFIGEKAQLDQAIYNFQLRFLTAGG